MTARQLSYFLLVTSPDGSVHTVPVSSEPITLGRSPLATICVAEEAVSRRHCVITRSSGRLTLLDQGSTNGTKVNEEKVSHAWLSHGDVIQLGATRIQVRAQTDSWDNVDSSLGVTSPTARSKPLLPHDQLALIQKLTARLALTESSSGVAEELLDFAQQAFPAERGFVLLNERGVDRKKPKVIATNGCDIETASALGDDDAVVQRVLSTGKAERQLEPRKQTLRSVTKPITSKESNPVICAPIHIGNDVMGVIYLDADSMPTWVGSSEMMTLLTTMADVAALALSRVKLCEALAVHSVSSEDAPDPEDAHRALEAKERERTKVIEEQRIELAARLGQLEHLQQARAVMAESLVHDIKNLVSALKCNLSVVERDIDAKTETALALDDASTCAHRIETMSLDVLDVARMEDGSFPLASKPVSLLQMVENTTRRHASRAKEEELSLELGFVDDRLVVIVDPSVVSRVLDNLIDNALRYTNPGGQVMLTAQQRGNAAEITVRDTGPGIAPEDRDRIFDQWFQVDSKSSRHHGVGLYFCRLAVEAHGGAIRVEGQSGDNRFIINLPGIMEIRETSDTTQEFFMGENPDE